MVYSQNNTLVALLVKLIGNEHTVRMHKNDSINHHKGLESTYSIKKSTVQQK